MKYSKSYFYASVFINNDFIGGCGFMNKDDSKEKEIKKF